MILQKPNKIAICLNTPSLKRAEEQMLALSSINEHFEIEWDLRCDRFTGDYISFSDMVNESVLCTDSEFMIFINPKAIIYPEDIHTIINDLCNGDCLSTVIAFGLWGCTKELFREIGLMDERLLGSEYEDDDFLLRIIEFDKSISWRLDRSRYDINHGPYIYQNKYRGISANIFRKKWNIDYENQIFNKNEMYLEEKKLPSRLLKNKRLDISCSWGSFKNSNIERDGILEKYINLKRLSENFKVIDVITEVSILIKDDSITVFSNNPVFITIALTYRINDKDVLMIPRFTYNMNNIYRFTNKLTTDLEYGLIIWHNNHIIYSNEYMKISDNSILLDNMFLLNDQIYEK